MTEHTHHDDENRDLPAGTDRTPLSDRERAEQRIGGGSGGLAGMAAGAGIGSLVGPIGTIIGALGGVVGGWWAGRAAMKSDDGYSVDDDDFYQSHYESSRTLGSTGPSFDATRPAYQLGHMAGMNPDYRGQSFDDVETHLSTAYSTAGTDDWNSVRDYARDAYGRSRDRGSNEASSTRATEQTRDLRDGSRGLADRVVDAADDLKDRVDGNPASHAGRDATDRPER